MRIASAQHTHGTAARLFRYRTPFISSQWCDKLLGSIHSNVYKLPAHRTILSAMPIKSHISCCAESNQVKSTADLELCCDFLNNVVRTTVQERSIVNNAQLSDEESSLWISLSCKPSCRQRTICSFYARRACSASIRRCMLSAMVQ